MTQAMLVGCLHPERARVPPFMDLRVAIHKQKAPKPPWQPPGKSIKGKTTATARKPRVQNHLVQLFL